MSALTVVIAEAQEQNAETATRCKDAGWFGALFHVRVQGDILADVQRSAGDVVQEINRAKDPESEGGENITPNETKRILRKLGA